MYRLKSKEEFLDSGWTQMNPEILCLDPPGGTTRDSFCIVSEMFDSWHSLTEDDLLTIQNEGIIETGEFVWTANMFTTARMSALDAMTDTTGSSAPSTASCGCIWKRHPLYCRCVK